MKYRFSGLPLQFLAFFLAALLLAGGFLSGFVAAYDLSYGLYDEPPVLQTNYRCRALLDNESYAVVSRFAGNPDFTRWDAILDKSNLRFLIIREDDGTVVSHYTEGLNFEVPKAYPNNPWLREYNYNMELGEPGTFLENIYVVDSYLTVDYQDGKSIGFRESSSFEEPIIPQRSEESSSSVPDAPVETVSYQILWLLPQKLLAIDGDHFYEAQQLIITLWSWFTYALWIFIGCAVLFLVVTVFLCCQAAHRPGLEQPRGTWFERFPLDILLCLDVLAGAGIVGLVCVAADCMNYNHLTVYELKLYAALITLGVVACGLFLLGSLRSFAARVKISKWWNTVWVWCIFVWLCKLIWKPIRWFGRTFRTVSDSIVMGIRSIGMVPRAVVLIVVLLAAEATLAFLMIFAWSWQWFWGSLLLLLNVFLILAGIWTAAQLRLLQNAGKALAEGDLNHQLDTSRMYWDFKTHGNHLNAIADGMNHAVEQRMKSERLKTELITNVSHDIKTPLTSIVNYVDLLQKPHSDAEAVQYLEILDRQAKRLKRLTENLVEASKASTGSMTVDLQPTDITELFRQVSAEYRERLDAGKLDLIVADGGNLQVMADGKLLWRILDNLLNNVVKYGLAGTRVYLTAQQQENRVNISVKNISREELNIDADELMERFVRGDRSRHTEGSGLGLNIARSLTQLQNGEFLLTVDGDLFKAEVLLPIV